MWTRNRASALVATIAAVALALTGCDGEGGGQKPTTPPKTEKVITITGSINCDKTGKTHAKTIRGDGTGGKVFGQKTGKTTYDPKTGKFSFTLRKLKAPLYGFQVAVSGCGMKKERWTPPWYTKKVKLQADQIVWFDR